MSRDDLLDSLLKDYGRLFDISSPCFLCGRQTLAYCRFTSRSERYVLIKRAVIWAAESNEHVVVIWIDKLDEEAVNGVSDYFSKLEAELVKPHREHMYSFITVVALCGDTVPGAAGLARKARFTKNYKFTLHGYCIGRFAAADLKSGGVFANAAGKPLIRFLKNKMKAV